MTRFTKDTLVIILRFAALAFIIGSLIANSFDVIGLGPALILVGVGVATGMLSEVLRL